MPKQVTLQAFLDTLNKQESRKNVKLNVEAELNASNQYDLKIKSIEVSKEVINELAIVPKKVKETTVKQLSLRELVIKGFEQVNKDLSELKQDVNVLKQDVALMKSTPTMKKEIAQVQSKDRTR